MERGKKPFTAWGRKVAHYLVDKPMSQAELAAKAGVKLTTLRETMIGRCAGIELIPVVDKYMEENPAPRETVV